MNEPLGLGADHSTKDIRTFVHPTTAVPITTGGYHYPPENINHQHAVGICTAIALTQNAQKVFGKKYSADFQYLLQKKYMDGNWNEGSAIMSALKVGKLYGFLPQEYFPYATEADRTLPYALYIAKLQAVPDSVILHLLTLCTDKIAAYSSVPVSQETLGHAIISSEGGILCRLEVGSEWWTPSWQTADINPLKAPVNPVSGHAIGFTWFNVNDFEICNTWGTQWNKQGCGDVMLDNYQPTEAWIPYYNHVPAPIVEQLVARKDAFTTDLSFGMMHNTDVIKLQTYLASIGLFNGTATGNYGIVTTASVKQFQANNGIFASGLKVGISTRALLNQLIK